MQTMNGTMKRIMTSNGMQALDPSSMLGRLMGPYASKRDTTMQVLRTAKRARHAVSTSTLAAPFAWIIGLGPRLRILCSGIPRGWVMALALMSRGHFPLHAMTTNLYRTRSCVVQAVEIL